MTYNDPKNPSPDQDYEVGYCRPPKETQFKSGQSGNPKGRKEKTKSVQAQMLEVLSKKVSITEGGKTKKIPVQEVILRSLANKAAKGDLKAAAFVLNLMNSPEYADTDAIDQTSLSSDDQAMLDEMMRQLSGADSSDLPECSPPVAAQSALTEPLAEHKDAQSKSDNTISVGDTDGGRTDV
ncbi:DUF5681 domain-containing protein [Falsihalocynthiibacter arcticus]|uniref:DUF5681 domain-containing protein n=1 Tax=Falsihalocynthiibacter arcticus TaxID=1579316 RepID=A0A126V0S6_9RHOB|nr:DUF5681 domain-containing protein [Falsihalocynthiibacter arcticus]AML51913.1 hypothetical protein RC74_12130 [Falsihalocynthiibacter arcticus]